MRHTAWPTSFVQGFIYFSYNPQVDFQPAYRVLQSVWLNSCGNRVTLLIKNTPDEKLYNPYPSCGITGFLRTICYDATGRQPQLPAAPGPSADPSPARITPGCHPLSGAVTRFCAVNTLFAD